MKKTRLGLAAIALLTGGLGQATPTIATPVNTSITIPVKEEQKKPTKESRKEILPTGSGGIYDRSDFGIMTPKLYGQYLQANNLQKWNKSKRK